MSYVCKRKSNIDFYNIPRILIGFWVTQKILRRNFASISYYNMIEEPPFPKHPLDEKAAQCRTAIAECAGRPEELYRRIAAIEDLDLLRAGLEYLQIPGGLRREPNRMERRPSIGVVIESKRGTVQVVRPEQLRGQNLWVLTLAIPSDCLVDSQRDIEDWAVIDCKPIEDYAEYDCHGLKSGLYDLYVVAILPEIWQRDCEEQYKPDMIRTLTVLTQLKDHLQPHDSNKHGREEKKRLQDFILALHGAPLSAVCCERGQTRVHEQT